MNAIRNKRLAWALHKAGVHLESERRKRRRPCQCNATAKAIAHVQAQWVVAGIDRD